jgi:plastocyanin
MALGTFEAVGPQSAGAPVTPESSRPVRRRARDHIALLFSAGAVVLAACGGGSDDGLPDADIALVVERADGLRWEPDRVTVDAGTLSVAIVCERGANHNLVIEETGEEVAACAPGQTAFGEVTLDPGLYTYVCTVPGHEVTMRGVLEVR